MTTTIWRYSHFILAISSSIFILIAAITGGILAVEPIKDQVSTYAISDIENITLAKTIAALQTRHKAVLSITVEKGNFVRVVVITKNGRQKTYYIDPLEAKTLGVPPKRNAFFRYVTTLHRSLFLKTTGRYLVGFFSFLLLLITITGILLIVKRQGGIRFFFSKVIKEKIIVYYHVVLGRYFFIPMVVISLTAMYLSLYRIGFFSEKPIRHTPDFSVVENTAASLAITDFPIFKTTTLDGLKKLEFPFSTDKEDTFILELKDKTLLVDQYTGSILSTQQVPFSTSLKSLSLFLHTAKGSIIWAVVLVITCLVICFFIYSGFVIALRRIKKGSITKNIIPSNQAEIILLVGSQNNTTFSFALSLYKALLAHNKKVYIDTLNAYTNYQQAKHMVFITATYGMGEAPSNADRFLTLLQKTPIKNTRHYSVVGFGSSAYPDFCKFAIDLDKALQKHPNYQPVLPLHTVNNQSVLDFSNWSKSWAEKMQIPITLGPIQEKKTKQHCFLVIDKPVINQDKTFILQLKPMENVSFTSGDLLSVIPEKGATQRLYSIAKIQNTLVLSVKKHDLGRCSNMLYALEKGAILKAGVSKNKAFHFSKNIKQAVFIANGTGIAPFLGMLQQNPAAKKHLFLGVKTPDSLGLYESFFVKNKQVDVYFAYSQHHTSAYVQDLLIPQGAIIMEVLQKNGVIFICGSKKMLLAVERILDIILQNKLDYYKKKGRIKVDCY